MPGLLYQLDGCLLQLGKTKLGVFADGLGLGYGCLYRATLTMGYCLARKET